MREGVKGGRVVKQVGGLKGMKVVDYVVAVQRQSPAAYSGSRIHRAAHEHANAGQQRADAVGEGYGYCSSTRVWITIKLEEENLPLILNLVSLRQFLLAIRF